MIKQNYTRAEINRRYRQRNREKIAAKKRAKRLADPAAPQTPEAVEKRKRYAATWYQKNKEAYWAANIKNRFGLTVEDYKALLAYQGGACAICQEPCASGCRLGVDHNHATGEVRALLCASCNLGLGKFKDCPDLLDRATIYLCTYGHAGTPEASRRSDDH